jgi:hypothetical protein
MFNHRNTFEVRSVMTPYPKTWLTASQIADRIDVHAKTLLRISSSCLTPFHEGVHLRQNGLAPQGSSKWYSVDCEVVFKAFSRVALASVETFDQVSRTSQLEA